MSAERYGGDRGFPTTQWSLVARVGVESPEGRREALGQLLIRYLPALQAHLIYGKHVTPDGADDLIQEFVASKILEKNLIGRAEQDLGKFRTFLLTALDRFLFNRIRDEMAKKRSPNDGVLVSMGERVDAIEKAGEPSSAFDVAWARNVISQAVTSMKVECDESDRADVWGVFECRLLGPTLEGTEPVDYAELVRRFGFQSPAQASNVLITAKRMYARALRAVVAEYAQDEEEIEAEIEELRQILAG